jgi:hypothetical protein
MKLVIQIPCLNEAEDLPATLAALPRNPARAFAKIPEAIHHPRGLSLPGPWSDVHGPHLTLLASEDFPANDLGGPANRSSQSQRRR